MKLVRDNPHEDLYDPAKEPAAVLVDDMAKRSDEALFEASRDPSAIEARRTLGIIYEQFLDEVHTPKGSSYFSDSPETKAKEEERKREEIVFLGAIAGHVNRALREQGIKVTKLIPRAEEPGGGEYVCKCSDRDGREYTAFFGWELSERLVASGGEENIVERMGQAVAREILAEHARYFERMSYAIQGTEEKAEASASEQVQHK